jgi:hypothetical protein
MQNKPSIWRCGVQAGGTSLIAVQRVTGRTGELARAAGDVRGSGVAGRCPAALRVRSHGTSSGPSTFPMSKEWILVHGVANGNVHDRSSSSLNCAERSDSAGLRLANPYLGVKGSQVQILSSRRSESAR